MTECFINKIKLIKDLAVPLCHTAKIIAVQHLDFLRRQMFFLRPFRVPGAGEQWLSFQLQAIFPGKTDDAIDRRAAKNLFGIILEAPLPLPRLNITQTERCCNEIEQICNQSFVGFVFITALPQPETIAAEVEVMCLLNDFHCRLGNSVAINIADLQTKVFLTAIPDFIFDPGFHLSPHVAEFV